MTRIARKSVIVATLAFGLGLTGAVKSDYGCLMPFIHQYATNDFINDIGYCSGWAATDCTVCWDTSGQGGTCAAGAWGCRPHVRNRVD
ncbi:MAG: hypothetical protein ABI609_11800 [Acidobacteriota bacterium]